MATVSISKSSLNVVSGGAQNLASSISTIFTTSSTQYSIITVNPSAVGTGYIQVGSTAQFNFTSSTPIFNLYVGPSETVYGAYSGGSAPSISWVTFQNT